MLRHATVMEIKRLLDEGELSQRKIARQVGVSRATVGDIASGKRALFGRDDSTAGDEECLPQEFARCPSCGARVLLPCVACAARHYRFREMDLRRRAA